MRGIKKTLPLVNYLILRTENLYKYNIILNSMLDKETIRIMTVERRYDIFDGNMYIQLHNIMKTKIILCQICFLNKGTDIHHIDRNRKNNNFNNLEIFCKKCHYALHHPQNNKELLKKYPKLLYFAEQNKLYSKYKYKYLHTRVCKL